ncbi:MAG: hypothetical protein OXH69_11130 [Acidobacteria bacterium]|nr:hypothetical protein [Acidobacteriota bacterium]
MTMTHVGRTFAVLSGVLAVAMAAAVMAAPAAAQTAEPAAEHEVTFTKDIAPILQRSCQKCHRPDSLAPMSLIDYEEVRPWARAIKYRTGLRDQMGVMPPWYIEKDVGIQDFKDDPSLTEEEILKIAVWADNGAPLGNPADMPPPVAFIDVDEWEIGQPDLIVRTPSVEVKADAPDWWGALADTPTNLPEDRYVAAVEFKEVTERRVGEGRNTVGGNFVFHHAGLGVVGPDFDPEDELARAGLSSWPVHEVGRNADFFAPEAGKLVPADAKVTFSSIHLHANGADTTARLDVGFKFHPKGYEPSLRQELIAFGNGVDLDIEGNDPNVEVEAYFTLPKHLKMSVYEPHMHAPGVRMCLEAIWGSTIETLNCSGYDHSWVRVYNYEDHAAPLLPKGTILRITGYFNNSASNPNVPDPRNWSGSGHRSVDQMFINIMQGSYLDDDQFTEAVIERRQTLGLAPGETVTGCLLCGSDDPLAGTDDAAVAADGADQN